VTGQKDIGVDSASFRSKSSVFQVVAFEGFLSLLPLLRQYLNHFVVFPFAVISLLLNLFNHAYQMNRSFVLK
jgi:hypothetical protein